MWIGLYSSKNYVYRSRTFRNEDYLEDSLETQVANVTPMSFENITKHFQEQLSESTVDRQA